MPLPKEFLQGIVDYAGLFPPAGLSLPEATARYGALRAGGLAWMLGRFVVEAQRLEALADLAPWEDAPWPLSVLLTQVEQGAQLEEFRARVGGAAQVDALEVRAAGPEAVAELSDAFPATWDLYFEIPVQPDPRPWVGAVREAGRCAKIRTGGVTADLIPSPAEVGRFLRRCAEAEVPFKATAGLHHPVRSEHPLTYQTGAPRGRMHGFLNVFLAAALATRDPGAELEPLLEEMDPGAFRADETGVRWRSHRFTREELADCRARFAHSFGSCSFEEPVEDLREVGLL